MKACAIQTAFAAALVIFVACSHREAPIAAGADQAGLPVADVIELAACANRSACSIDGIVSAGVSARGQDLFVVTFSADGGRDSECDPRETWLVGVNGQSANLTQYLVRACRRKPIPSITVIADKTIRYAFGEDQGANIDNMTPIPVRNTFEIALDPPTLLRSRRRSGGMERVWAPDLPPWGASCEVISEDGPCERMAPTLPVTGIDDAGWFELNGWKAIGLGDCAMVLGAAAKGSLGDGSADSPVGSPGPSLRALLTADSLFIELSGASFDAHDPMVDEVAITLYDGRDIGPGIRWHLFMDGTWIDQSAAQGHQRRYAEVAQVSRSVRRFRLRRDAETAFRLVKITYESTDGGHLAHEYLSSAPDHGYGWSSVVDATDCVVRGGELHNSGQRQVAPGSPIAPPD